MAEYRVEDSIKFTDFHSVPDIQHFHPKISVSKTETKKDVS